MYYLYMYTYVEITTCNKLTQSGVGLKSDLVSGSKSFLLPDADSFVSGISERRGKLEDVPLGDLGGGSYEEEKVGRESKSIFDLKYKYMYK